MDWISTAILVTVLKTALCFNIDPVAWKSLSDSAAGFGYQVVQRTSSLLVSAPLDQDTASKRGTVFGCNINSCSRLPVSVPAYAVNMSLGLTMASDPTTENTMVCGPTIPKDCRSITMYNGACVQIDRNNNVGSPVPSSAEECRTQADIAFLLDGSGSVYAEHFRTMKTFVKNLIRSFLGKDTQFAIVQFSTNTDIHYYFNTFPTSNWEYYIDRIRQTNGATYTAAAMQRVVNEVFSTNRGSRLFVKKVLIVITDGQSNDRHNLQSSANLAKSKNIVRFAIGVGSAFSRYDAVQELNTIASDPSEDHVFKVEGFEALDRIRETLQDKIFSIEGSSSGGESLKLEMSQEGFSAAYTPEGLQLGIVGANEWKGGFVRYRRNDKLSSYEPSAMEPDSYLGYSMAVVKTTQGTFTVAGAPRYQHRGVAMVVYSDNTYRKIDPFPWQFQSGEYFGAQVCAMDVNRNSYTDVVLISSPMYIESDREGRVYVCSLTGLNVECQFNSPVVLRGDVSDGGRFGSSLAVLPDLNNDGYNDLAVGAPMEDDNRGCIYIFHGEGGGTVSTTYSQKITGSKVDPRLKLFGMSISPSSFDLSGDNLPDLAVGSKGTVVLLRSKPIVMVVATVTFTPKQIPTQNSDCTAPISSQAKICFAMTRHTAASEARARINVTLTLDATRKIPNNRAYIREKVRAETNSFELSLARSRCLDVEYFILACPEDALNALNNEVRFTFEGIPSSTNLSPSLAQQAQTNVFHQQGFEINCGTDSQCVDDLKVDFNFTNSLEVKVGIDDVLNVTVSVENRGENSYNSRVLLTYPAGLSYRKFTSVLGRIECNSVDSEDSLSRGQTDCTINKPIFKSNAKVYFIVSYGIETNSELDKSIFVTANATSGNQVHNPSSSLYKRRDIGVKYSIFLTFDSTLSYNNFSYGQNDLQKPLKQSITVTNDIRELDFTVVIRVPVKLGSKDILVNSRNFQIPDCQRGKDESPAVSDFVAQIKENQIVDCSVAFCAVFRCHNSIGRLTNKKYQISANLSSGWIEQIGLRSAKFLLTSTANLEYDRNQYIFFSTGTNNNPPVRKIEAEVEVYPEPDFTKEIIGGSLGGLALLALVTAGLYKAGFFKSKYSNMMNESQGEGEEGEGDEGGEPGPEEQA
ncbi:uncharacterized protein V6R79_015162 [Siganus canaliculatus]